MLAGSQACFHLPYNSLPQTLFHEVGVEDSKQQPGPPQTLGPLPGQGGADTGVTERHRSHSTKELDTLAGCLGSTTTWLTDSERQNQLNQVGNRALPQGRGAARSSPVLSRALREITVLYSL